MAANEAGGEDGLVGHLTQQAKENPDPFLTLLGKVLPIQVPGDAVSGPMQVVFTTIYEAKPTGDAPGGSDRVCADRP
jgi:hypothetical protein